MIMISFNLISFNMIIKRTFLITILNLSFMMVTLILYTHISLLSHHFIVKILLY
jgi:hypothetical protein